MNTKHQNILIFLLLEITLNVFGQTDSFINDNSDRKHIDSLTNFIDENHPKKIQLFFSSTLDTIIGEKILIIEKQTLKKLCKFSLRTINKGTKMDIKFIDLFLLDDTLIKATVFYDEIKKDFWKTFYFKNNSNFSLMFSPRGMRISTEENGKELITLADKLIQIRTKKKLFGHN